MNYLRLSFVFPVFVLSPEQAFAYLDPGTGSIVIQSLIAGVAASALIIKTYWYRIKTFFGKPTENKELIAGESDNQDPTN